MLKQLINFNKEHSFVLACSSGSDSMCLADFYSRGGKKFSLAYFHHGTVQANEMQECVLAWGQKNKIPVRLGKISRERFKGESPEEYYRHCRYDWLNSFNQDIVTAQHLDDATETYLFSALNGRGKIMPIRKALPNGKWVFRPFLSTRKQELTDWCVKHSVPWVEDRSNTDEHYPRNFIRHTMMGNALKVNPGLHSMIKKRIISQVFTI